MGLCCAFSFSVEDFLAIIVYSPLCGQLHHGMTSYFLRLELYDVVSPTLALLIEEIRKLTNSLESGTYYSSRDIFDGAPLMRATQYGHREVIHLLMDHGARYSLSKL